MRQRIKRIDFISYWPDMLGALLLILGLMGEIPGPIPYLPIPKWMIKLHQDLSNDLIAIGITVLIIDNANQMLATRQEKKRLISQMGSPTEGGFAAEAVRQLRQQGWLYDGALRDANLRGANLSEASLYNANLSEANLYEANLKGAEVTPEQLAQANNLEGAIMPDGKTYKPSDEPPGENSESSSPTEGEE